MLAIAFHKLATGEVDVDGFVKEVQKITTGWYQKL
jgi:raffinose/stachyose/melibiose transport system substrate-binding protein